MDEAMPAYESMVAGTIEIEGAAGDKIEAYVARPIGNDGPYGAVIVLHHMHGLDESTKEIVRRFAHHRYITICPNLYSREGVGASPTEAAAKARAAGGVPDERMVEDVRGASIYAKGMASSNGKVGVIGYCSGGRQAFLAACRLPLNAAVDCYGPFVVSTAPKGFPLTARPIANLASQLGCSLLGLFGAKDEFPAPGETQELADILLEANKDFEFHTFKNAGHAFFDVAGLRYRVEAAQEGWRKIFDFFERHLANQH